GVSSQSRLLCHPRLGTSGRRSLVSYLFSRSYLSSATPYRFPGAAGAPDVFLICKLSSLQLPCTSLTTYLTSYIFSSGRLMTPPLFSVLKSSIGLPGSLKLFCTFAFVFFQCG